MSDTTPARTASCPECDADVEIDASVIANEIVPCGDCGVELEVTSLEPLKLEQAPEVEEDWGE